MEIVNYIKEEYVKITVDLIIASVGFFLALFVNSLLEDRKDYGVYKILLSSIAAEADSNQEILMGSFFPLFENGIVLRKFSTASTAQMLSNPIFVKQASRAELVTLNEYIRVLNHANAYAEIARDLRSRADFASSNWEDSLINNWRKNLRECESLIKKVGSFSTTGGVTN